jgi:type II secretory pathway predicted ATPase ExeA
MPTHHLGLQGAAVLSTQQFQLSTRIVDHLVSHDATGVIHGPAGAGKTFAVQANLERLRESNQPVVTCSLAFTFKPTMRQVASELVMALSGAVPRSANRFALITHLTGLLAGQRRLLVIDEAQNLNTDCIELLRHLHDHPQTRFALLYVGGDGC